ncbi:hypothetical protein [Streptomyces sp. NPDC001502]|uniref:hypothetical protein n=1 Tax=Streptomyces sp. NPDC001502 TaxID=3364578 RepID=UPI0036B3002C
MVEPFRILAVVDAQLLGKTPRFEVSDMDQDRGHISPALVVQRLRDRLIPIVDPAGTDVHPAEDDNVEASGP